MEVRVGIESPVEPYACHVVARIAPYNTYMPGLYWRVSGSRASSRCIDVRSIPCMAK